jgi:hypothetical protein
MVVPGGQAAIARRVAARCAGLVVLAASSALLGGCGGEPPTRPAWDAPYQLSGPTCLRALAGRQVAAVAWQAPGGRGGRCSVDTPVRAAAGRSTGFAPPLETSCAMLVAWSDFEGALQRAARTHLGAGVAAVRHFGSHACRRMTGNAGRTSLHARARAIDVSGFTLTDGRAVTVASGWRGSRAERRFLRAVAEAACRHFSVTLTPASDRAHRDHLHVDIGPWRLCGA